jgi:imidazolonepropionase-like amidohydrolase
MSDQAGSIDKRKFADIGAVDGDPLVDIKTMKNTAFVTIEGEIYTNQ